MSPESEPREEGVAQASKARVAGCDQREQQVGWTRGILPPLGLEFDLHNMLLASKKKCWIKVYLLTKRHKSDRMNRAEVYLLFIDFKRRVCR